MTVKPVHEWWIAARHGTAIVIVIVQCSDRIGISVSIGPGKDGRVFRGQWSSVANVHVLALLSFQQPTFHKFTWNQLGIDLQCLAYTWDNTIQTSFPVRFWNVGCWNDGKTMLWTTGASPQAQSAWLQPRWAAIWKEAYYILCST